MSKKIEFVKEAVGLITGLGVSQIIDGIISTTTPTDTKYQKTTVAAGKLAISWVVGDIIRKHTDSKIDSAVEWWQKRISNKQVVIEITSTDEAV